MAEEKKKRVRKEKTLEEKVNGYASYLLENGYQNDIVGYVIRAAEIALRKDGKIETGLNITRWLKGYLEKVVKEQTKGMDMWMLDEYCHDNITNYEILERYYEVLKIEAPYLFESFIFYMERNRHPKKRFYLPRKETLHIVCEDLQALEDNKSGKFFGLSMPSRVGKALAYDTPVLTDNGWKKHGDLTIRDRVIGYDGKFKRILAIHNPCKMEYKVKFSNGEEIICHGNHEWYIEKRNRNGGELKTFETHTIAEKLRDKDGHFIYTIPPRETVIGEEKTLCPHPYVLGAWLGDGRNQNPDICGTESDYAIVQKILDCGYDLAWDTKHKTTGVRYYGFKNLRQELQVYDMCHSRRRVPKYIPDEYLTASENQRLELLAGLLDTDGCLIKKEHRYQFTTSEESLRDGFIALVNSFGWRTSVLKQEPKTSSSGITARKPHWVIRFNPDRYIPCQLERKQLHEYSKQRSISIVSVEKLADSEEIYGNCITVEDGLYRVGKTLIPTHNSTICIFFLAWIACKRPNSHSAMGGHSGILARGFYKELCNLIVTEEYMFYELFLYMHPEYERKKFPTALSAEEYTITLGDPDRFATITCRGIDGTWTGAVDVSQDGYLYIDDLVRDREHSLSPVRMENTYQEYLNKMVDRKNDGAKELMVGTLWNVLDPLMRIEEKYGETDGYVFRKIPALNENDESNFAYKINGFSTEYYREMREKLDNAEWMAKFMQRPYVREGLIFPPDELQFFNGILPEGDYRIVSACDVAWGGGDSTSMPIGAEYDNGDVYIFAWVFNNGAKEITIPLVTGQIMSNQIQQIRFEANNGGELYCQYVDEALQKNGYKCSCTHKKAPGNKEKSAKIIAYSGDIKRKYYFLTPRAISYEKRQEDAENGIKRYERDKEYQKAMDELMSFVAIGKNPHDDAADSLAQLEMFIEGGSGQMAKVEFISRPF